VKSIYGFVSKGNLSNNFYFSRKGIIFKTKPVIYDIDKLPDSVTDSYKHNDAIDSVSKLYANLKLDFETKEPTEILTISDSTMAITNNNYRRLPNQLLTNYNFFNNFKILLHLYDYLSELSIHSYTDNPNNLKNIIFNDFLQEFNIFIYLTNKVRLSDFIKKINSKIPMNRMAKKNEYNGSIIYLLSDASSYVNGAIISADGGRTTW